ncbi:unnamed protein product, partial [Rotaria sordida]
MFDSESTKESARPVTIDEESLIEITEKSEELLQSSNIDTEVDTHDRNNSNSTNQITSTVTLIRT